MYRPVDLFKLISSSDEKLFWKTRYQKEDLSRFMEEDLIEAKNSWLISGNCSYGKVLGAAQLDLKSFLGAFREYLNKNKLLKEEAFCYSDLENDDSYCRYKSTRAKKIVFCEGANIINNPYFKNIPMSLNKGELLTIESKDIAIDFVLQKKGMLLPLGDNKYKFGATYAWKWEDLTASSEKREELELALRSYLKCDYTVLGQETGIRPSVKNRRPILGGHPEHKNYIVFNGLGSRGCSLAPMLSEDLLAFLNSGKALSEEVAVERYFP